MPVIVPIWLLCILVGSSQSSEVIFSAGLTSIASDLNLPTNIAQLCSAFFYVGFTIGVFSFGRISDLFGRKRSLLIGFAIYTISSAIIIFLNDIYSLIFWRMLQAFGGSAGSIIPQAISRDCYQGRALSKVYSIISIVICCIPTIAATIGGFIVDNSSWRYNALFLTFLGVTMYFLCLFLLPETNNPLVTDRKSRFLSVVKKILKDKKVLAYSVMAGFSIGMIISFIIEFSVIFVKYLGIKQSIYGLLNIFVSISMLLGTLLNIHLISIKYDYKKIMQCGFSVSIGGCLVMFATGYLMLYIKFSTSTLAALFLFARMLQGVGHIITMPYILSTALKDYQSSIGSATSVFNGVYYIVITLVIMLTSFFHSDTSIYAFGTFILFISCLNLLLFKSTERS